MLAEIGEDMSVFPTPAHLASWAGMCPGQRESAGKRGSGKTRKGSKWLRAAWSSPPAPPPARGAPTCANGTCAYADAVATPSRRRPRPRDPSWPPTASWTPASPTSTPDQRPSARSPQNERRRAVDQLHRLGYNVTLALDRPSRLSSSITAAHFLSSGTFSEQ